MAYNDTPLATDLLSDTQAPIRENFQLLESAQVVDEGSTADGDYIRFENGWGINTVSGYSFTIDFDITMGSWYRSRALTWAMPVGFVDTNYIIEPTAENRDGIIKLGINPPDISQTEARFHFWKETLATGVNFNARIFAIGRWK